MEQNYVTVTLCIIIQQREAEWRAGGTLQTT